MKNLTLPRRDALASLLSVAAASMLPLHRSAAAQPSGPLPPPLRVAFVYVSPVSDGGWTHQHNLGRLEMERALGDRVISSFVEKVPEGPDAERVIRDLAAQGNRLIVAASFGYMEPTLKVAREFPEVAFEHAGGYRSAANVSLYNARFYEGRYLAGIIAARTSRSKTLGYVAGMPIPEVLQGINAFTLGARSVDPDVKTRVVWTNSWFDPGREREASFTLVGQGADVLTHHTDSTAVPQAAEARGVRVIGYHSDMSRAAPTAHLASVTHHWGRYYTQRAQALLDGTWKSGRVWAGIGAGFVRVDPIAPSVPAEVRELVRARQADIVAGRLHPFAGPVRDNQGRLRIDKGPIADDALAATDWLVDGVVGRLPGS